MFFTWLKQYMPRGLYGRAALILILPVLSLQLLVSVVFIQRHFDGVTRQMTNTVSIEMRYLRDAINLASSPLDVVPIVAAPLELHLNWPATRPQALIERRWDDLTGGTVLDTFSEGLPELLAVSLLDRSLVTLWMETVHGPVEVTFRRQRVSASNPHQLLVIMVVMGIIMTTIAYFFLRNQLRPIKRMANAAAAFGKGRIVPYRPAGAQEVRSAGTAFLDMRNRIERQNQSRTLMLSGVSHDLRTPLTRMRLGLSLIDEKEAAPLIRDVDDMQRLVDAFLDFARADASDALEAVDPHALLSAAVADAERGGQTVTVHGSTGSADAVMLRPMALRRALANLMNNAHRYGTQAQAAVHVTDRAVCFSVEDDGPGIAPEDREAALRPFVRLDPSRNQDHGSGVGLGLAIVADIARNHGGTLRLGVSETLGGLKAEIVIAK